MKCLAIDYRDLGKRIKRAREKKRLSQADLAAKVQLSTQHISNVENAKSKIGLEKLVSIANTLDTTVDEFLCGSVRKSRSIYNNEIAEILEDFSDTELKVLPEFLRTYNSTYRMLKHNLEEKTEE